MRTFAIQVELFISVLLILIRGGQCLKTSQPDFVTPLRDITVEVGRNATFECFVTNIEKYRVGWIKADTKAIQAIGKHVISNNQRISVSHDSTRSKFRLHISGATLDDAGPYMCQINSMPVRKQSANLTVIKKADIIKVSGETSVNEGGMTKLFCETEGYPPPKVYWTRDERDQTITIWRHGHKIQVDKVQNETLELHRITRSQMGSYLCIATNGHPPAVSKRVFLKVNFRPVISVPEPRIRVRPGEDVSLECNFEFYPRGLIWWERESGEILSASEKYSTHDYILNEFTVKSRLIIKDFAASDMGSYSCVGRNMFNTKGDREEAKIIVKFIKSLMPKPETTTAVTVQTNFIEKNFIEKNFYETPEIRTIEATTETDQYSTLGRNNFFGPKKSGSSRGGDEENNYYTKKPNNQNNRQKNRHRQDQYWSITSSSSASGLQISLASDFTKKLLSLINFVLLLVLI